VTARVKNRNGCVPGKEAAGEAGQEKEAIQWQEKGSQSASEKKASKDSGMSYHNWPYMDKAKLCQTLCPWLGN
jgi:hypothetical protein